MKQNRENRQQERGRHRKQRGVIQADLLALLILAAVAGLLLAGILR